MSDIITNLHVWLSFGAKFQNELTAAVHFILKMHFAGSYMDLCALVHLFSEAQYCLSHRELLFLSVVYQYS